MSDSEIESKKESNVTIKRGQHNRVKTYVDIQKVLLDDESLTLDAKGLICYLLGRPDNWIVHPRHLAKCVGVGKTKIYKLLNLLIKTGYASKTEIKDAKSRFSSVVYEFYEEKIQVPKEIKKQSTVSANPDTVNPDTDSRTLKSNDFKENISLKNNTLSTLSQETPTAVAIAPEREEFFSSKSKDELSPLAKEVSLKMMTILQKHNEAYRPPKGNSLIKFNKYVMILVDKEKQDPAKVLAILEFAAQDTEISGDFPGWSTIIYSKCPAEKLWSKFSMLSTRMASKKNRKFAPSSDDARAEECFKAMRENAL